MQLRGKNNSDMKTEGAGDVNKAGLLPGRKRKKVTSDKQNEVST